MAEEEYDALDNEEQQPAEGFADFDAFWSEERVTPTFDGMPYRMFGKDWRLPRRLPALFEVQMHRVRESSDPEEIQGLLSALLPGKLVDDLIRRNTSDRRLSILLAWATANTSNAGSVSLERAAELVDRAEEKRAGKARKPRPKKRKRQSSGRR